MKTVLIVIDTLATGGAERSLVELSSRLDIVRPIFLTIYSDGQLAEILRDRGIPVLNLNSNLKYGILDNAKRVASIIERERPDIVHSTLFRSDLISRVAKLLCKVEFKLVSSIVSRSYGRVRYRRLSSSKKIKLLFIQCVDSVTSLLTDRFISNSHAILSDYKRHLGMRPEKVTVIHRGRDPLVFRRYSPAERQAVRSKLGLTSKDFLFLSVGRLMESKGHLDLIEAFSEVFEKAAYCKLWIAGEGPNRERLRENITKSGSESAITLLGNRGDVPDLLNACDCFVFPTYYEGLPGSLIEAMLTECNIIASNIPENQECVDELGACFFRAGDVQSLGCLMSSAIANRESDEVCERRQYAGTTGRERFSLHSMSDRYQQFYSAILNR